MPNGTISAETSQLEEASSSCEWWGIGCAALVVVAVIAELVIVFIHPPYDSCLERWGSGIADAAIALGIVGEVSFGIWNDRIQTRLRLRSNEQLEATTKAAGDAIERAADAELQTEKLKKEMSWRSLSREVRLKLTVGLLQANGEIAPPNRRIKIFHLDNDIEAEAFATDFSRAFKEAGWDVAILRGEFRGPTEFGIWTTPHTSNLVHGALINAGIPFSNGSLMMFALEGQRESSGRAVGTLFIGPKRRPFDE